MDSKIKKIQQAINELEIALEQEYTLLAEARVFHKREKD